MSHIAVDRVAVHTSVGQTLLPNWVSRMSSICQLEFPDGKIQERPSRSELIIHSFEEGVFRAPFSFPGRAENESLGHDGFAFSDPVLIELVRFSTERLGQGLLALNG